jgi:hypothetical protein
MKRLFLSIVVLSFLAVGAHAESFVPPSYFRTMFHTSTKYAHEKALFHVQQQMQQLIQLQSQRALRGLPPTSAMLERARRLALLAAYHEQGIRTTNGMISQGRVDSRRHHWEMMLRHYLIP